MKTRNLKENYGTQTPSFAGGGGRNFSIGADLGAHTRGNLGTRGADSNFSQRMQALVPNDYYDLLEEDEDEIDEDYVVENSRYSLRELALLESESPKASNVNESKKTPAQKPKVNENQFWIAAIRKAFNTLTQDDIKEKFLGEFEKYVKTLNSDAFIADWINLIARININALDEANILELKKLNFNSSIFSSLKGVPNELDLKRKIIIDYAGLIKDDQEVFLGKDGTFPDTDFGNPLMNLELLKDPDSLDKMIKSSNSDRQKIEKSVNDTLLKEIGEDYSVFKKILTKRNKRNYESLFDLFFEEAKKEIMTKINRKMYRPQNLSEPAPEPSTEPTVSDPGGGVVRPDAGAVTSTPAQDNDEDASGPSLAQDSDSDDLESSMTSPPELRSVRTSTSTSSPQTSSTSPSSSNKKEKRPFIDEFFDDPMFDNPFVKMFIKRPGDEHVGLPDFYRYFKNKNKKNESFDLSLRDRKLSHYLIEQDITGAVFDVVSDLGGDVAAAAASGGTFGLTSTVFILKNIYELKETSKKADIAIEAFLLNPSDKTCDNIEKILSDIITDFIDLVQRIIEVIPDPVGELGTAIGSVTNNFNKILKFLKSLFVAESYLSKIQKLGKIHLIIRPFIKIILSILDSEQAPEEIKNDKRFILGTLNKMVLIIDLTEDYYIQKKAAETAGIRDFQYQHKVFQKSRSFNDYNPETSHARKSPEKREREYAEEMSSFDSDFFQESLRHKSLACLLSESEDDMVDEEVEQEGEELDEFSGVGAVAGFSLPLGASPRGPGGAHSSTSGGRAYPYSTSDRSKFNKFSKKTFGGK